jgi:hypothetical protein
MSREIPCLSPLAQQIVVGSSYQHYKGPQYKVLSTAFHSETLEELVVYLDENGTTWVRPLTMFLEHITINGQTRPRFQVVK